MEFHEFVNRMIGCAIAVHCHFEPEQKDGIARFFLGYLRALRVLRGPPIAATRLSAIGTFRDRGERVGPPVRSNDSNDSNDSVLNGRFTCARPVSLVAHPRDFTWRRVSSRRQAPTFSLHLARTFGTSKTCR